MTMLDYAYWITQVLLALGVLCAIYRVYKGPSVLDRVISVDVILIIVGSVMLVDMAYNRHTDFILFVVVTAVIGFLGAVAIARYAAVRLPRPEESQGHALAIDSLSPEPEAPTARTDNEESTSWFADLTQSGFVPERRRKNDDAEERQ